MARDVIRLEHATFQYPLDDKPCLVDVSCSFEEGKLYGIVGPNGAGKTTLSLLVCGFATTFEKGRLDGEVTVLGRDITDYDEGELASHVGYVMQNPFNQISGSKETVFEEIGFGLENLGVDPDQMEQRILAIAEETNISDLLLKNPFELSGGQQQRVALASVLVMEPEILVIDEPTSQLDPAGTEGIFDIIAKLKAEGKTVILVEHKVDLLAEYADEIIALEGGHVIASGPTAEVLTNMDLLDHGVQLPRVSVLCHELASRGVELPRIPIVLEDAVAVLKKNA